MTITNAEVLRLQWMWEVLKERYGTAVRCTRRGFAFPAVRLLVEVEPWARWISEYGTMDWSFEGWTVRPLTMESTDLDMLQIGTMYAEAEEQEASPVPPGYQSGSPTYEETQDAEEQHRCDD